MRFCEFCGKQIPDEAAFCPYCGKAIQPETDPNQTTSEKSEKRKFFHTKWFPIVISAIVALIVVLVIIANRPTTIDLDKYTTISVSGYNTVGTATYKINVKAIEEDYGDKIKLNQDEVRDYFQKDLNTIGLDISGYRLNDWGEDTLKTIMLEGYLDEANAKLSPKSNLSNGDKVTLKWKISQKKQDEMKKYLNVKLVCKDKTKTVHDLPDIKTEDLFKDVTVSFSGINGQGEASYKYKGSRDVQFAFNHAEELANNDKVTLYVGGKGYTKSEYAKQHHYLPKEMSKTYTVSDLGKYVQNISDLSDDNFSKLSKDAVTHISKYVKDNYKSTYSLGNLTYIGAYLQLPKENEYSSDSNLVTVVMQGTVSSSTGEFPSTVVYYPVTYTDVIVCDSGRLEYTYDDIRGFEEMGGSFYSEGYGNGAEMYSEIISEEDNVYSYQMTDGLKQFGQ